MAKVRVIMIHLGPEKIVQIRNWKDVCSKFCNINIILAAMIMAIIVNLELFLTFFISSKFISKTPRRILLIDIARRHRVCQP